MTNVLALAAGAELVGDFRIERVLGAGGFGITYLAEEIALQRMVTIKEYFPSDFAARGRDQTAVPRDPDAAADFQWGLDRFIDEAQILARFDHPNIVKVFRYFRANDTAYMVLHFEEGQSLKAWLRNLKRAPRQRELDDLIRPLLDALATIHAADYLHRDVAPDNIILRTDGSPVLIDFGSARGDIARHSRTVSALVKPGYSPYEQYAENGERQGPWTDIYALGATLYHAISGKRPPDAPSRVVKDEMAPARLAASSASPYRQGFLRAIDRALALDTTLRPQSVAAWRGDLLAPDPARPGWLSRTLRPARAEQDAGQLAKTRLLTRQPGSPPPPDMPDHGGGLIDYIELMKRKAAAEAPPAGSGLPPLAGSEAPVGNSSSAAPSSVAGGSDPQAGKRSTRAAGQDRVRRQRRGWFGRSRSGSSAASEPPPLAPPAPPVAPAPAQRMPPRPKPVRAGGSRQWRTTALTLLFGLGIVGAAIAWQDLGTLDRGDLSDPPPSKASPKRQSQTANRQPSVRTSGSGVSQANRARSEGSNSGSFSVSRLITGSIIRPARVEALAGHGGGTLGVAFSVDGSVVVTSGADAAIKVWRASNGSLLRTLQLQDGPATAFALSGRRVLTGHGDGAVQLWDFDAGTRLGRFKRNEANIWSVAFAGDPNHFVASGHDWTIALWDARKSDNPLAVIEAHDNAVQAVAFSPLGPWLASGGADKVVKLWNAGDLSVVRTYRGHKEYVTALAFSPDGRYLAAAALDGRIRVWRTSSRGLYRMNSEHDARVTALAFSPDGDQIASADQDGAVQVWRFRRGRTATRDLASDGPAATAVAFSPDGRQLAVANAGGSVRLLPVADEP